MTSGQERKMATPNSGQQLVTRPLMPNFAVEVTGLDLASATPEQLTAFDNICSTNPVVVVRKQSLTPTQMMTVSNRLGEVSAQHRVGSHPDFPGITILSNKKVDGKMIGVHEHGRRWHTDGTTYKTLGLTTMLYGIECPPEGADTLSADAVAAFEDLPEQRRKDLEQVQVVHNRAHLMQKYGRTNKLGYTPEEIEAMKDVIHPVVVRSPVDGRKSFFLTNGSTKSVVGMTHDAGFALVEELINHVTQDKFVYRHKWQAGDVLIWNDMCTMHLASWFDDTKYDRVVYRTWMRPFNAAAQTTQAEAALAHH
jgi:taurine dioxygenase